MAYPSDGPDSDDLPLWRRYELTVHELINALDPTSSVTHDAHIPGLQSRAYRQIDIWVVGQAAGADIKVAVECKRLKRFVSIGLVDQFLGKLIDIGADRGILYSYSGFTSSAVTRALGSTNPRIMAVALDTPGIVKHLRGVPGYPADLLAQDVAPQWIEELPVEAYEEFLIGGTWPKYPE